MLDDWLVDGLALQEQHNAQFSEAHTMASTACWVLCMITTW
jgi:hypothetical protein